MASSAPPSANAHGSTSILSEKVQRALQVRTDTPAMKAALDALAHLQTGTTMTSSGGEEGGEGKQQQEGGESTSEVVVVDSRSVRVAIEQDALQQALLLQGELQKLVATVGTLRQGVTDTAAIADRLYRGIQTDVTVTLQAPPDNPLLPPLPTVNKDSDNINDNDEGDGTMSSGPTNNNTASNKAARLEESQLARTLADAFAARDQAKQRLAVVQAFLDKFDLSEQDSRLLDHYNFEDISSSLEESPVNGMACLNALERVVHIRQALGESFGPAAAFGGGGSMMSGGSGSSSGDGDSASGLGTSSALRMMESLAQKQEQAYERLYNWLQSYLRLYPSSTNRNAEQESEDRLDEVLSHPFCQLALATLQHVPAFYTHTLELIANARRSQATKQFLLALTSGVNGMPPLEMKAHDAVVYVGEMLSFVFRSFSVEADFARNMRSMQEKNAKALRDQGGYDDDNNNDGAEDGATEATATEITEDEMEIVANPSLQPAISSKETLALTMSGVARPLKSRIAQVIATLARSLSESNDRDEDDLESNDSMMDELEEEGGRARHKVTQLYEICGLLLFYLSAMEHVEAKLDQPVGQSSVRSLHTEETPGMQKDEASPLMKVVIECLGEATSAYEAAFRVYAAMMENLALVSGNSEASLANRVIEGVVDARMASPGFSSDVPCPKDFQTTLSLDWALEVILEASLNTCKSMDDAQMLQHAILKSQKSGLSDTAQDLTKRVQEKESELIDELVARETVQVMELCGFGTMATAWKNFQEASVEGGALSETMAAYPGLSPEEVQEGINEFYSSLYSPPIPSLETAIKDPVVRKGARRQIAQRVCTFYSEIYQTITSGSGGYPDTSFLGHTPEQVVTLFSA